MYLTNLENFADGFCWTCPSSSCPNYRHSIRKDSILHNRKTSLHSILQILWHNCNTLSIFQTSKQESLSPNTVRSKFAAIRHYMVEDLLTNHPLLGGPRKIDDIDESLIRRKKYNRERIIHGKWLLVGVQRVSKEYFMME